MTEFVNIKQFAKLVGVSPQRIGVACKTGQITFKAEGQQKLINKALGLKEWEANRVFCGRSPTGMKKSNTKTKTKVVEKEVEVPMFEGMTTADADRKKKVFEARLSELKFLEQSKTLIKKDEVTAQAYESSRKVRDAIMSVPARFAHELAVETDPRNIEILLNKLLAEALEQGMRHEK